MNKKLIGILLLSTLNLVSVVQPNQAQTNKNQYSCVQRNGNPTTIVKTSRGTIELIVWQSNFFGNWNPLKRCQEVTSRFQKFSNAGEMRYVTTGIINGLNVICIADPKNPKPNVCKNNGLLITLEPKDIPEQVKNELFDIAGKVQGGRGTKRGGCQESSFYTRPILQLDSFLDCVPTIEETPDNSNNPNLKPEEKPIPNETPKPDNGMQEIDPLLQ